MQDPEEPPIDFNPPEHLDFDGSLGGSADDLMDIVENISPQLNPPMEEVKEPTPHIDGPHPDETPIAEEIKDIDPQPQAQVAPAASE